MLIFCLEFVERKSFIIMLFIVIKKRFFLGGIFVYKRGLLLFLSFLVWMILISPVSGQENLYKMAVLPFDDGSIDEHWWGDYDIGTGVADVLVTSMLNLSPKRFRLIERDQIDRVMEEQNFGASGRVDTKSAAAIGKILGVQFLV